MPTNQLDPNGGIPYDCGACQTPSFAADRNPYHACTPEHHATRRFFHRLWDRFRQNDVIDNLELAYQDLTDVFNRIQLRFAQTEFLLQQAPMQNAPYNRLFAAKAITKYAYIHPETFRKMMGYAVQSTTPVSIDPVCPTLWVPTKLMPEGCVIYTPNTMPGLEQ
jgi:hypothetical protein